MDNAMKYECPRMVLSRAEAAASMGISMPTLNRLVRCTDIPYFKVGDRILFPVEALNAWLSEAGRTRKKIGGGE